MFLFGCGEYSGSIQSNLEEAMLEVQEETPRPTKYRNDLYGYYLAPDVGRVSASNMGNTFNYGGNLIQMNLNVQKIVNDKYYEGKPYTSIQFSEDSRVGYYEGSYVNAKDEMHAYNISIYKLNRDYYTVFDSDTVLFGAVSNEIDAVNISKEMLRIAKTLDVNYNEVVAKFSLKEVITYESTSLDLFENIVPEEGNIEELFKTDEPQGDVDVGD